MRLDDMEKRLVRSVASGMASCKYWLTWWRAQCPSPFRICFSVNCNVYHRRWVGLTFRLTFALQMSFFLSSIRFGWASYTLSQCHAFITKSVQWGPHVFFFIHPSLAPRCVLYFVDAPPTSSRLPSLLPRYQSLSQHLSNPLMISRRAREDVRI